MNTRNGVSAWCIDHPIATLLLTFALVLLGAIAFPRLPVAPLPEADFPTIQVTAQLPGASPETMASSVATPLEVQFSAIPGMTQMTSSSALGSTRLPGLSRDWPSSTRQSPAFTPSMMFSSLFWYSTFTGTLVTLSPSSR